MTVLVPPKVAASWYDDAVRTIVDLPEEQLQWLASVCAREGISRAEAIRRAVEASMHQNGEADFKRALDAAFGMWKDRGIDGVEYQRELRAEWERDAQS